MMVAPITITMAEVNWVGWPRTEAGPPTAVSRVKNKNMSLKRSM